MFRLGERLVALRTGYPVWICLPSLPHGLSSMGKEQMCKWQSFGQKGFLEPVDGRFAGLILFKLVASLIRHEMS
jgi:hypothetical protein